jgi:hypothetical protein
MSRRLVYQISVGETPAFYKDCIASVAAYCQRFGIDHIVQTEPILNIRPVKSARSENALRLGYLPIYEKETAFGYLDRYRQIAVIDADVYIRPPAPNLFDELQGATFAGVLERDMPLTPAYLDKIQKYSKAQHGPLVDVDWKWNERGSAFYNMGVMLFSDRLREYLNGETPRQFIQRPEFERFVNGEGHWKWSTDQTLLNYWIKKNRMKTRDLSWKWNALYGGVKSVEPAHFIHFFLSAKLPGKGSEIPRIIAELEA